MPVILGANSASGGYDITNSARFNSGSSDRLTRTQTAGNRQIFTWSFWFKISELLDNVKLILAHNNTHPSTQATLDSQAFQFYQYNGSSLDFQLTTTQLFRDVSAWYHMVIAVDTTQATSSNRIKIYLNGSQITAFSTSNYPSQNFNTEVNDSGAIIQVSGGGTPSNPFGGYMTEIYNIDGQQLTPTSFGETDEDTGIWKPKAYTGTYGTNGFYLQFKNSSSLGTDSSGNGNTFTVNNLTSIDQTTDTPTNNFATWNSIGGTNLSTFTEGNLRASTATTGSWKSAFSTIGASTGKWYAEIKWTAGTHILVGVTSARTAGNYSDLSVSPEAYTLYQNGNIYNNNGVISSGYSSSFSSGTIIGIALDKTNNKIYWSLNGTFANSADPVAGTGGISLSADTSEFWQICISSYTSSGTGQYDANFGSPIYSSNSYTDGAGFGNFSYQVPSGYYSLNSKNLATFG